MIREYPFPWQFDRGKYPGLYLMSCVTEAKVQADILDLLGHYKVDGVPIDAGGRRQRGRMMGAARAAGVELAGVQNVKTGRAIPPGFADLEATLAPAGRALYIEVKAPPWIDSKGRVSRQAGVPSKEQLEFLFSKHQRGALVMVAWASFDVEHWCGREMKANREAVK